MRLESNSKNLLAITKSKAKMFEFGIDEQYHIALPNNPEKLLILTIGILGQLSSIVSSATAEEELNVNEEFLLLKEQLSTVAQYFEALDHSLLREDLSDFLHLVGASSFYLADMPGNSLVLANEVSGQIVSSTLSRIEEALIWILRADILTNIELEGDSEIQLKLIEFCGVLSNFFRLDGPIENFDVLAQSLRTLMYEAGDDEELFYVDVLIAIAKKKIWNSSIVCLPKYTRIGIELWSESIRKRTFIQEFWPAQRLIGSEGALEGKSAVIQIPTSAGKTKSIELIIRSAFLSERARVVVVVAPFRALCREISSTFSSGFAGENVKLNELQDITKVSEEEDDFLNLLLGGGESDLKRIIVSTPEKLVYLLRYEPKLAAQIEMLIFDEGHQFDTGKRGVTYELLLASLKESVNENCQIVLISAVISNTKSIGEWIYQDKGVDIEGNKSIPTVRSIAFTSWQLTQGQLQYIDPEYVTERNYFVPRVIQETNLGRQGREKKDRIFPEKGNNLSIAAYLALKLCHQGPVAVFCGVKSTVTTISESLVDYHNRGLKTSFPIANSDESELKKITYLAKLHFDDRSILTKAIALGILPHSSNVPNGLRVSVEWAMENKKACLVICTSTLAQGVNLPIKYLVITSTFQAGNEIKTREFQNLIGRAGRSGYHTEGSIIFADSDIYDKRRSHSGHWKWDRAIHLLNFDNTESCLSSLKELIDPFKFELSDVSVEDYISDPSGYKSLCIIAGEEHDKDVSQLLLEIEEKNEIIEALESYFLSYLKDNPDTNNEQVFIDLAEKTLAYHLASDAEKELIVTAFQKISIKVLALGQEKISYFGKALLGIDRLLRMEEWIENNRLEIETSSTSEELLRVFWPIVIELSRNQLIEKIRPENLLLELACKWIGGASYYNLFDYLNEHNARYQAGSQARKIKMNHVIDFTDHALGFEAMLLIGALADIFEGRNWPDELIERTRFLQSSLKLGLSTELDFWLYSKGFVDREVCKLISSMLESNDVKQDRVDHKAFEKYKNDISAILATLPSYFSKVEI